MWLDSAHLIDCGIDWFTSTSTDYSTTTLLLLKAEHLLYQEEKDGYTVKPWRMAGYSGWLCGRLQFGIRGEESIVRLSSGLAAAFWWDVYQITGRCSRIDLQATFRIGDKANRVIAIASSQVSKHFSNRNDGPSITNWSGSDGGRTLYIGSRSSDLYCRLYNKGVQSGLAELQGCIRLELEVKKRSCEPVIAHLLSSEYIQLGILETLTKYAGDRGIVTKLCAGFSDFAFVESRAVPDRLKVLRWLKEQVKPSVSALIEYGLEDEVRKSLGLYCSHCSAQNDVDSEVSNT
jgi:DNA relaxase NicK